MWLVFEDTFALSSYRNAVGGISPLEAPPPPQDYFPWALFLVAYVSPALEGHQRHLNYKILDCKIDAHKCIIVFKSPTAVQKLLPFAVFLN